jgi:hypothetical protein
VTGEEVVNAAIFGVRRAELALLLKPSDSLAPVNETNLERRKI